MKYKKKKSLSIGQTLETNDRNLPYGKNQKPDNKSRPVIIADKQKNLFGEEEFLVIPASKQETRNTFRYGKFGIKNIRNNIEIEDNEGLPIKLNDKFKLTENCSKLPEEDTIKIYDRVLNHTRFSSENRKKQEQFHNRYKKK